MAPVPKSVGIPAKSCRMRDARGFTLIDLMFVLALIGLLSILSLPGFLRARGAAQASSALGTMRAINSGQVSYAITCGFGFYAPDLPTLGVRPPASSDAFLPDSLTSAPTVLRHGYTFTVTGTPLPGAPATCNGLGIGQSAPGYSATAEPIDPGATERYFGTNADGIIYEHTATLTGQMPESGPPPVGVPIR